MSLWLKPYNTLPWPLRDVGSGPGKIDLELIRHLLQHRVQAGALELLVYQIHYFISYINIKYDRSFNILRYIFFVIVCVRQLSLCFQNTHSIPYLTKQQICDQL